MSHTICNSCNVHSGTFLSALPCAAYPGCSRRYSPLLLAGRSRLRQLLLLLLLVLLLLLLLELMLLVLLLLLCSYDGKAPASTGMHLRCCPGALSFLLDCRQLQLGAYLTGLHQQLPVLLLWKLRCCAPMILRCPLGRQCYRQCYRPLRARPYRLLCAGPQPLCLIISLHVISV